jgi:hypothetical protein
VASRLFGGWRTGAIATFRSGPPVPIPVQDVGPAASNVVRSRNKRFPIWENLRAELRAEFFNLLNHASFGLPGHRRVT